MTVVFWYFWYKFQLGCHKSKLKTVSCMHGAGVYLSEHHLWSPSSHHKTIFLPFPWYTKIYFSCTLLGFIFAPYVFLLPFSLQFPLFLCLSSFFHISSVFSGFFHIFRQVTSASISPVKSRPFCSESGSDFSLRWLFGSYCTEFKSSLIYLTYTSLMLVLASYFLTVWGRFYRAQTKRPETKCPGGTKCPET